MSRLVKDLPKEIQDLWVKRAIEQGNSSKFDDNTTISIVYWAHTREGFDFWYEIEQENYKPFYDLYPQSKTFEQLQPLVIEWAKEKGILEKATPLAQVEKTFEEVIELKDALIAQSLKFEFFSNKNLKQVNTKEEIKDALGDILVTIIIQSEMQGLSLIDCLESAYNVISKRTGKMVNGQFVKDE